MDNKKMMALSDDELDNVSGGSIGFNPDGNGTFTMVCKFTGQTYYGVKLEDIMKIGQYAAYLREDQESEEQIIAWAQSQGFLH